MPAWLNTQLSSGLDLDPGLPFSSGKLRNPESCNLSSLAWLGDDLPELRVLPSQESQRVGVAGHCDDQRKGATWLPRPRAILELGAEALALGSEEAGPLLAPLLALHLNFRS